VTVNGDDAPESGETFKLVLTPVGQTPIMGMATILNDDAGISVGNATSVEGGATLKFLDRFVPEGSGGLTRARGSTFGPDGNLYVASGDTNSILRYDGASGSFLNTFVSTGSGGLNNPLDVAFGPDGNLYVTSSGSNQLLRYDGSTGAFLDVVASGLSTPQSITFGSDGSLYIVSRGMNEVLRYSNAGLSVFVAAGSGGLSLPNKAAFGPDGNLYVTSEGTRQVLRYDGTTGAFINVFATTGSTGPIWLGFGTDGYLYVTTRTGSSGPNVSFLRFDATTGASVDSLPLGRDGWAFQVGPGNIIYDSSTSAGAFVERFGPSSLTAFTVSLNTAVPTPVTVNYSTADGSALSGSDFIGASGTITFAPGETSKTILISTIDDAVTESTETFAFNLSNATGGVITASQGVATIQDNDATKFYVVNDGSPDQTYRYGEPGNSQGVSTLGSGNTAPRGVASNAAGTTVWVADANGKVYVYNPSGGLLGSWTAGSLPSGAQVEGIATNGADIWLVDAKQDKVFKYAGAASRLSGSQTAASSFGLSTTLFGLAGNTNPKGIVTDGTSIWVVDDGGTDKVYKYSLSGSSLGNWSIDAANASPTGLTINPANVSDIWVVDNGTDKVYQYTAAAGRTSGSQNAIATFALAAGNTNPQDIADPPAISIADASLNEVSGVSAFVAAGSGGLFSPKDLVQGPDGNIYVADANNSVVRYNGSTGQFIGTFVAANSGGLNGPYGLAFGPDGNLYVSSRGSTNGNKAVLRYNGTTGAFIDSFVPPGSGGLGIPISVSFGADGNLYVTSGNQVSLVMRYQGPFGISPGSPLPSTGQTGATFVVAGSGGLDFPSELVFGPGGNLYVTSQGSNEAVLEFDGTTGGFIRTYVAPGAGGLAGPRGLAFDQDGRLYVADILTNVIHRYDSNGQYLDDPVLSNTTTLVAPVGLMLDTNGRLLISSRDTNAIVRYDRGVVVSLSAANPTPVSVAYATADGTATAGADYTAQAGTITFAPGQTSRTILLTTLDDTLSEPTETFTINLFNPTGATIADGQAVAAIIDNDAPAVIGIRVNDGSAQRSRVTDLTVTFATQVTFASTPAAAFTLTRVSDGAAVSLTAMADVIGGVTVVTLNNFTGSETQSGSLADGRYTLTALASQISANGQQMTSNYTFGDTDGLFRFFGDVNGDRVVNGFDFGFFKNAFGTQAGDANYLSFLDFNGDGVINGFDLGQFKTRFGTMLP
jgi:DNA-binding beta-propeller fold protein YncE